MISVSVLKWIVVHNASHCMSLRCISVYVRMFETNGFCVVKQVAHIMRCLAIVPASSVVVSFVVSD